MTLFLFASNLQAEYGLTWADLTSFGIEKNFELFFGKPPFRGFFAPRLPNPAICPYISAMPEFGNRLDIICLESEAFYALVEEVVSRLKEKNGIEHEKWIDDEEAMRLLHVSSKTTLQKYRDDGSIRFSQPSRKLILYDRDSILEFLNAKAKDTF